MPRLNPDDHLAVFSIFVTELGTRPAHGTGRSRRSPHRSRARASTRPEARPSAPHHDDLQPSHHPRTAASALLSPAQNMTAASGRSIRDLINSAHASPARTTSQQRSGSPGNRQGHDLCQGLTTQVTKVLTRQRPPSAKSAGRPTRQPLLGNFAPPLWRGKSLPPLAARLHPPPADGRPPSRRRPAALPPTAGRPPADGRPPSRGPPADDPPPSRPRPSHRPHAYGEITRIRRTTRACEATRAPRVRWRPVCLRALAACPRSILL